MKFQTQIEVVGMKSSKGTLESGQAYDSSKIYALVDLDASKGTAKGKAVAEYNFGLSDEFEKFKNLDFPIICDATLEIVTNGRTQRTQIVELRPVNTRKAPSA